MNFKRIQLRSGSSSVVCFMTVAPFRQQNCMRLTRESKEPVPNREVWRGIDQSFDQSTGKLWQVTDTDIRSATSWPLSKCSML